MVLSVRAVIFVCMTCAIQISDSLNNGLALTPPMGWLTWERYRCNTDCEADPDNCLSEKLLMKQADCMVSEGYRDLGYQYVTIDDCWLEKTRGSNGQLQPDHKRFPSGIKALSDYMHSKGLKMGIYEDFGTHTCAGYPGSEFYMQTDAQTFADWGIDLLKFDGCNSAAADKPYGYEAMSMYLNMTGRPILLSCEWPLYLCKENPTKCNFTAIRDTCNMWRNYNDVQDSWDSVTQIIQYFMFRGTFLRKYAGPGGWNDPDMCDFEALRDTCNMWRNYRDVQDSWDSVKGILKYFESHSGFVRKYAGPGGWNDPDMLVVGNYGLSYDEERAQMAMWAIMASPLIMSTDLCNMNQWSKEILQNKRVIAVNQDALGIQGEYKFVVDNTQLWNRPISPAGSFAAVFLNLNTGGGPAKVKVTLKEMEMTSQNGYNVTDTFSGKFLGTYKPKDVFVCSVNPSGVVMITAHLLN